jgi:hypothetical protein
MRLILTMATAALAVTGLAACGQSEQALRTTSRAALLLGCRNGDASSQATLNQAGISVDRFCTCAVDRYLQSASVDELKQLSRNSSTMPPGLTSAAGQCMAEMMGQSTPAAGAPPAGNEGALAPAAPGEAAPAESGAPAEENVTAEH